MDGEAKVFLLHLIRSENRGLAEVVLGSVVIGITAFYPLIKKSNRDEIFAEISIA